MKQIDLRTLIATFFLMATTAYGTDLQELAKEESQKVLTKTDNHYTFEELSVIFKPILLTPEVELLFEEGFKLLADPAKHVHSPDIILKHLRCLYGDLYVAHQSVSAGQTSSPEVWQDSQMLSLAARYSMPGHESILNVKPDLMDTIEKILSIPDKKNEFSKGPFPISELM